jgi:transposase
MHARSTPAPQYRLFVGVDIAAKTLTAAWQAPGGAPGRPLILEQSPAGFARLQAHLRAGGVEPAATLVVMEATGSYWVSLATTLAQAGFRVSAINPAQAHHFAKALLKRAKTDAIDAQTLAQLAALLQPAPWTPPPAVYAQVQQRHALAQLPVVVASVRERMDALLAALEGQIAAVESELPAAIEQDAAWAAAGRRQAHESGPLRRRPQAAAPRLGGGAP